MQFIYVKWTFTDNCPDNFFFPFSVKIYKKYVSWICFQASAKCEKDLSNLTLSEMEQRELYQAAQIIQKAYRSYKGRKKNVTRPRASPEGLQEGEEQAKEAKAAVVIQNYYRRYKQVSTAPFNRRHGSHL